MAPLSKNLTWELANPLWASTLNPLIASPLSNINFIEGFKLSSGTNTINHGLGRMMKGWFVTDINAAITYYRSQPLNSLTLTLTASGPAIVNIGVF